MMPTEKINTWQATALLTCGIIPTAILFPPQYMAQLAGRDAWLAFLLAGLLGGLLAVLIVTLSSFYPESDLLQIAETLLGPVLGKTIILLYVFFFIIVSALVVREFSAFMVSAFMQFTPLEVFSLVMVAIALYAVYQGLEVISRVSEIVFISVIFSLLLFVLLSFQELDFRTLLPILEAGMQPVMQGSIVFFVWTGEIFFLAMLYPHLERPARAWLAGVIPVALVTFFVTAGAVITESYFGFQFTARQLFPLLGYVRLIGLAAFWERIEALVILIWVAGIFVKVAFFIYVAVIALVRLFNLSGYRCLLLPTGALVFVLSIIMFESTVELNSFLRDIWPFFSPLFALVFPLLFLLLHFLKKALGLKLNG